MQYELNFAFLSEKAKLFGIDSLDSVTVSMVFQASESIRLPVALSRVYPP